MDSFLKESIQLAESSLISGGFPVGAIICADGVEVGRGTSSTQVLNDLTAHAEVQAIRAAMQRSKGGILYSSLEPCMMCLAACAWAGIKQVVFACARSVVDPIYYESSATVAELSQVLVVPIKIVPDLVRQDEVIALIRRWETVCNQ
jgi:tRNA(Arg) A34 adenosine deaminase TadA